MTLARSRYSLEGPRSNREEGGIPAFSDPRVVLQAGIYRQSMPAEACSLPASIAKRHANAADAPLRNLTREQRIKRAVYLSCSGPGPAEIEQLRHLSPGEWRKLLSWMDISGLALYFYDQSKQLGLRDAIPQEIVSRLQQNMDDNSRRTRGMIGESIEIQFEFQKAGLTYAVMKGISLSPASVPRPELRHQFDLDYLIAEKSAPEARRILERRGYRLYAISGKSWEFKIHETPNVSIKDLYKDLPYRAVELHLETSTPEQGSRLSRAIQRKMFGMTMPVFSPVDLFVGQAMHAFKDVCSAFSRTSHLLEFHRHVLTHRDDHAFWRELRNRVDMDRRACFGLGVATYLNASIVSDAGSDVAPEALTGWTVDALPPAARLWIDLYGHRTAFGKHPGTKFYLFLQRELEASGVAGMRPVITSLLPSGLPPLVVRGSAGETMSTRISRYRLQVRYLFSRLRFHIVEGVRYAIESYRWHRRRKQLAS